MTSLAYPDLLDRVARAGKAGVPLPQDPLSLSELETCLQWGFAIESSGGRLYLPYDDDPVVPCWVERETPSLAWDGLQFSGYLQIGSTNDRALTLGHSNCPAGTLVYAEQQNAGRGRSGRKWISPPGTGLYFSLVLRPRRCSQHWPILTHVTSVALVQTLQNLCSEDAWPDHPSIEIKWPNDVLLQGRKCAGILLEAAGPLAVVGVGVNIRPGSLPEDLRLQAITLEDISRQRVPRRKLLVRFLSSFQELYQLFEKGEDQRILALWKASSSMWNETEIWIVEGDSHRTAVTCGLTDSGALRVRTDAGLETIVAGDISIRQKKR